MLSRLAPLDKALVLILVPLWVVVFALGVKTQVMGGPTLFMLELSAGDARSYPTLTGDFFGPWAPYEQAALRTGDRLIRLGDADLRGVGTFGFSARALDETERDLTLPLLLERDGERDALPICWRDRRRTHRRSTAGRAPAWRPAPSRPAGRPAGASPSPP